MEKNVWKIKFLYLGAALFLSCVSLAACSKTGTDSFTIKYVGNSCFYIQASDGTRIVTDPYGSGFNNFAPFPSLEADLITVSHEHPDHTGGISEVNGGPKIITIADLNKPMEIGVLEMEGYPSKHIQNMGDNTVFVFRAGDLKIVHMGETDKIDSPEAIAAIKDADVLLAYNGDLGEAKNKDIFAFARQMNIKVVVPQHYSMDPNNLYYNEPDIDQIIKELPQGTEVVKENELIVNKAMKKQFIVLSPMG